MAPEAPGATFLNHSCGNTSADVMQRSPAALLERTPVTNTRAPTAICASTVSTLIPPVLSGS